MGAYLLKIYRLSCFFSVPTQTLDNLLLRQLHVPGWLSICTEFHQCSTCFWRNTFHHHQAFYSVPVAPPSLSELQIGKPHTPHLIPPSAGRDFYRSQERCTTTRTATLWIHHAFAIFVSRKSSRPRCWFAVLSIMIHIVANEVIRLVVRWPGLWRRWFAVLYSLTRTVFEGFVGNRQNFDGSE